MIFTGRLKQNLFPVLLMIGVLTGGGVGVFLGEDAVALKPFGDLFLRFLFVAAVPLVFFSISSTFASFQDKQTLSKILLTMSALFILTGVISALMMIIVLHFFPLVMQTKLQEVASPVNEILPQSFFENVINNLTVTDFYELLSRQKMLAMILFSALFGLSVSALDHETKLLKEFLDAGAKVMMKMISYVMFYAPFGLGCYAAYMVGTLGADLLKNYGQAVGIYYLVAVLYFFIGFSIYLIFMGKKINLREFWQAMISPAITAFTLGSSVASIPVSLKASERLNISKKISEVVIPVGATIHMDGTCLSAVLKIAFAFSVTGQSFGGLSFLLSVVFVALLSGIVMGGIPGGGFMSEMMIVSIYGLPLELLPILSMIGMLVDAPATTINVVGDNVIAVILSKWIKLD